MRELTEALNAEKSIVCVAGVAAPASKPNPAHGSRGSSRKNELPQDEGFSKNLDCTVDRGAQYKVYERIRTSVRLSGGRWHTCTGHDSFPSVVSEQALCGARADGAAGRCASLHPYRIDHGTWLA